MADRFPTRRQVLFVAGAAALEAGVVRPELEARPYDGKEGVPDGEWWMYGRDPGRTGYAPAATLPTTEPTVRWHYRPETILGWNSSLSVGSGNIYVRGDNRLVALDRTDGEVLWDFVVRTRFPGPSDNWQSMHAGPVLRDETVYIDVSGRIYSVSRATGDVNWHTSGGHSSERFLAADNTVFLADGNGSTAIDATTGARRWTRQSESDWDVLASHSGTLLASNRRDDRGSELIAQDPRTGGTEWRRSIGRESITPASVAAVDGVVFVGGGTIRAIDTEDGSTNWTDRATEGGASAVSADGERVYVAIHETELVAFEAATGEIDWRRQLPVDLSRHVSPVVTDDAVYVPVENGVAALGPAAGEDLFEEEFGEIANVTTLAAAGETLLAAYDGDGTTVVALE